MQNAPSIEARFFVFVERNEFLISSGSKYYLVYISMLNAFLFYQ